MLCVYYKDKIIASVGIMPLMEKKKVLHRASFGICVEEKHWGNGIGKILTHNSILLAFELGYEQIELGVFADNHRAKKMYHKFGFQEWGRIPKAYRLKDGSCHDEILMGLRKEWL
ncbi:GNAT family N-acetyltransferase [Fusobacterium necrophorum]|nr:GNAT family N-acetyltransferase [Fusobacterium necrophorum]